MFRTMKRSLYSKYMFSYLLVIIIGISITTITSFLSRDIVISEVSEAHYNSLNKVKDMVDSKLMELDQLYIQIGLDATIKEAMYMDVPLEPEHILKVAEIQSEFFKYKVSNSIIENLYIYLRKQNMVLSDSGRYDIDFFEEVIFSYDKDIFEYCMNNDIAGIVSFKTDENSQDRKIVYCRPLPLGRISEPPGKLIVLVDENIIKKIMEELKWTSDSQLFITDSNDNILLTVGDTDNNADIKYTDISEGNGVEVLNGNVVSYVNSDVSDWQFISIIPEKTFFINVKRTTDIALYGFIVFLSIGLLVSWILAKRNLGPIDKLISFIEEDIKEQKSKDDNEYEFIDKVLHKIKSEREQFNENIENLNKKLKNQFLKKLLDGSIEPKTIDEMKSVYSIDINNEKYYVAVFFYVDDLNNLIFRETTEENVEPNIEIAKFFIANMIEEMFSEEFDVITAQIDTYTVGLINFDKEQVRDSIYNIANIINTGINYLKTKFGIAVSASISNSHQGYIGIQSAYSEALESMEYQILMGSGRVILFRDIHIDVEQEEDYYFLKDIRKWSQMVLAKDLENAMKTIDDIFNKWFVDDLHPANLIRYRMNEIINTTINIIKEIKISHNYQYSCIINKLIECKSLPELRNEIINILINLQNNLNKETEGDIDLHVMVMDYINKNYHLQKLNISMIADIYNVNISYLSNEFKKKTGIGALDYLQITRIEKAKELLRNTEKKNKEILSEVGFTNEVSFIRVFKRLEGITPGQFRELNN